MRSFLAIVLIVLSFGLTACEGIETKAEYPQRRLPGTSEAQYGEREGLFGKGGISLLGGDKKDKEGGGSGIAVNAYLWRAALDTISFMPLTSADPFGGTILTDWYEDPATKGERVKANIFIMGRQLRTDALKVTLFRQVMKGNQWQSAAVDKDTVLQLENTILTRARQLKVAGTE